MAVDLKQYRCDTGEDAEFSQAVRYEKVKLSTNHLYWKPMFRWHKISFSQIQRIFRRVQDVHGRLCCGGRNFRIEWIVLLLKDATELEIHLGEDVGKKAEALLEALKAAHPQLQYGRP